jgi:predicted RNA binding protein YcfA (HicA-like mRNA interferase family)
MSRRLPACTGLDVLRPLERGGFQVHRVDGSRHSLRHRGKPTLGVVVPVHRKDPPSGTARRIIKQSGLTEEESVALHTGCTDDAGGREAGWTIDGNGTIPDDSRKRVGDAVGKGEPVAILVFPFGAAKLHFSNNPGPVLG